MAVLGTFSSYFLAEMETRHESESEQQIREEEKAMSPARVTASKRRRCDQTEKKYI